MANAVVKRSEPRVTAVAWQLTNVREFGLSETQTQQRVYLVTGDALSGLQTFGGHLAFAQLLALQRNRALSACGFILKLVPFRWIGALGYALIARFRHRLPGGTPACAAGRNVTLAERKVP